MMILDGCKAQIVGLPDHLAWLDTSSCKPHSERRRRYQARPRSEEHTSELQSQSNLVCRLLLEKKKPMSHQLFWWQQRERSNGRPELQALEPGHTSHSHCGWTSPSHRCTNTNI